MNVQRLVVFYLNSLILSTFYRFVFLKWECSPRLRSRADCDLNVEASLVAVFLAVANVSSIRLALDAEVLVHGEVGELDGQQGLQVLGVQQLAVVRVVLQREALAQAKVLDLADLALILFPLRTRKFNFD